MSCVAECRVLLNVLVCDFVCEIILHKLAFSGVMPTGVREGRWCSGCQINDGAWASQFTMKWHHVVSMLKTCQCSIQLSTRKKQIL